MGALIGLAGCIEGVQEHFMGSVQGVIPIELHSEASRSYNIQMQAYERKTNRQTYDHSFAITPGENVQPEHLSAVNQSLQIVKHGEEDGQETVREVSISGETELVLVTVTDDELEIEAQYDETETSAPNGNNTTNETPTNATSNETTGETDG
ncbi:Ser-Asp rich fibrinogen-binding, bone sialoprotein-binding protein [Natrialba asiatica DSM 12278]|uniref:Ser-Asp rich fibrinogen-binding, bone sialoprotein-binding protein n=1 Tax=Natrialba asiatica (strain ATCC 700177 / DSM 12278 / JCM 9576 / FERM P-10747 / NBRC 102637 / 172P1) TaxID=29540 RepID=M0AVH0_NATA1|nr:Ser-Asp rich fibrinogen-binding, bone sialoprotein-binding protein [Natrialba asiatica DSM 12278]